MSDGEMVISERACMKLIPILLASDNCTLSFIGPPEHRVPEIFFRLQIEPATGSDR